MGELPIRYRCTRGGKMPATRMRGLAGTLLQRFGWLGLIASLASAGTWYGCSGTGGTGSGTDPNQDASAGSEDPDGGSGSDGGTHTTGDGGGSSGDGGSVGGDGGGGDAMQPPDMICVPSTSPDLPDDLLQDINCDGIDGDKSTSIFVATTGDDANAGTMDAPVKTVARGLTLAAAQGKTALYLAKGTYNESVTLISGISLYGGYDAAAGWQRQLTHVTTLAGGPTALTAQGINKETHVELLNIQAASGAVTGGSSYGVFVTSSPGPLYFYRDQISAGDGANGAAGGSGANGAAGGLGGNGDLHHRHHPGHHRHPGHARCPRGRRDRWHGPAGHGPQRHQRPRREHPPGLSPPTHLRPPPPESLQIQFQRRGPLALLAQEA